MRLLEAVSVLCNLAEPAQGVSQRITTKLDFSVIEEASSFNHYFAKIFLHEHTGHLCTIEIMLSLADSKLKQTKNEMYFLQT